VILRKKAGIVEKGAIISFVGLIVKHRNAAEFWMKSFLHALFFVGLDA
jgi:hypothetical protein